MQFRRSWNWNHPWLLRHHPRQGYLCRRGFLLLCKLCNDIANRLIGFAVLCVETWNSIAKITLIELRALVDFPGQEAFAERAERNEADAQLFEHRDNLLFRFPPP